MGGGHGRDGVSVLATSHGALKVNIKMPSHAEAPVWQDIKDADL